MFEQKTVAFDLDGTILEYHPGMANKGIFGPPIPGMISEMRKLMKNGWKIIIWTCRGNSPELQEHLKKCNIPYDEINVNTSFAHESPKIYADVYVDDRSIGYRGDSRGLANRIMAFRPWYKYEKDDKGKLGRTNRIHQCSTGGSFSYSAGSYSG